jgi:hypothetical protein
MGELAVRRLGIAIPSNNPDAMLGLLVPTLPDLVAGLENVEIRLLMTLQEPWTSGYLAQLYDATKRVGISIGWNYQPAESPPRMCFLRQMAINCDAICDIYMIADDNMQFSPGSGQRYAHVLDYFASFPGCGLVQCHRSDPFHVGNCIGPTSNGLITTAKGLFFRNISYGQFWPLAMWDYPASLEETVGGYRILDRGYFPARQYNNPTRHTIHRIGDDETLHSRTLIEKYGEHWVRETYHDPTWTHESERFPKVLQVRAFGNAKFPISFSTYAPEFTKAYLNDPT